MKLPPTELVVVFNKNEIKTMIIKREKNKGITLVEILLYMAIISIVLVITSAFLTNILGARIKNQTINEVESQGLQVMQVITQKVKGADSILLPPTTGVQTPVLTVVKNDDDIKFEVEDGIFYIEKDGERTNLTNDRIFIYDLNFENLSREETPGIISFEFTIEHINPGERGEYSFEKNFFGSASLRNYN